MSVRVDGLEKRFASAGAAAVQAVSFTAPAGKITTLLGPSGSGKTTVLRMIAGLEPPDRGAVCFGARDVTKAPVRARGVGFVFQGYALFEHLTVRENVAFGPRAHRVPRAETAARVEELLSLVQLDGLGDRRPRQLSGGQRQRVAFARALATRPEVLLLDEPFGALDARVRLELREWLRRMHEQTKLTTILVTHDQEEALELSEQVIVMHEGRVQQAGTPADVYDRPASPFVASFIGNPSVLRGRIEGGSVAIGPLRLPGAGGGAEGTAVQAFVRPHEVRIARADGGEAELSFAKVERLTPVGGLVKVDLRLATGESLSLQIPRAEMEELRLRTGDPVMLDLGRAKIFVEDYSI